MKLNGAKGNTRALGASVEVVRADAPNLVRYESAGSDYLAQSEDSLFFGLGEQSDVKKVIVHWASGKRSEISGKALQQVLSTPDRLLTLKEE